MHTFSPEIFQESTLYIGAVAFVLAVIAWIKRRQLRHPELLGIAILMAAAGFVLALGIQLHWLGKLVVSLPRILQPIFHRTDMPTIYLPAYYLYRYLPFFSKMRVMMRFGLFTLIFTSLMAGLGAYLLTKSASPKSGRWVGIGLLVLVFIDFYPGVLQKISARSRPARWIPGWRRSPTPARWRSSPSTRSPARARCTTRWSIRNPSWAVISMPTQPEQYRRIRPVMNTFPSQESVDLLRQLGVTYVVVDSTPLRALFR